MNKRIALGFMIAVSFLHNELVIAQGSKSLYTAPLGIAPYTFTYNINGILPNQTITTSVGSSVSITIPSTVPGTSVVNLVGVQDSNLPSCSRLLTLSTTVIVIPIPNATILGTHSSSTNSYATLLYRNEILDFPTAVRIKTIYGVPSAAINYIDRNLITGVYHWWAVGMNGSAVNSPEVYVGTTTIP